MSEKPEVDYSLGYLKNWSIIGLIILAFITIIVIQFPFQEKIDNTISSLVRKNPACPMDFEDYHFNFIGVEIVNVKLSPSCTRGRPLSIKKIDVSLNGFSFSPFGPTFEVGTEVLGTPIVADLAAGITGFSVLMKNDSNNGVFEYPNRKISLSRFANMLPVNLSGDIYISLFQFKANYSVNKIEILTANITSNNLIIPDQKIMTMLGPLPLKDNLVINNLLLQIIKEGEGNKIKVKQLTLGDDQSLIRTEFTGSIKANMRNFKSSLADLSGKLKIDFDQLSEGSPLAFGKSFLDNFDQVDGFYQIQIRGPIGNPETYLNAESPR